MGFYKKSEVKAIERLKIKWLGFIGRLRPWELNFVISIRDLKRLSVNQKIKLDEIYEKYRNPLSYNAQTYIYRGDYDYIGHNRE